MSFEAVEWATQQRGLKPSERFVLTALSRRANGSRTCFPSFERIAEDADVSRRSVASAIRSLERRGLIETVLDQAERVRILEAAGASPRSKSSVYRILRPLADSESTSPESHVLDSTPPTSANAAPSPDHTSANGALVVTLGNPQSSVEPVQILPPTSANVAPESISEQRKEERCSLRSQRARTHARGRGLGIFDVQWQEDFERWYAAYPRKKARDRARAAFFARMREGIPADEIIAGLSRHVFDDRERFIPYPATWLNGGSWRDETGDMFDPALRAAGFKPSDFANGADPMMLALIGGRS